MLQKRIINLLGTKNYCNYFVFSGRVALDILAKKFNKSKKVLLPNYICNVVNIAFLRNDYQIFFYSLDEYFEPNFNEIEKIINEQNIDIILFASLYGSGKWIDKILDYKSKIYNLLRVNNVEIIFDFAQDISLINKIVNNLPKNIHVVSSFNNKSIPNIMGGIIISNIELNIDYKTINIKLSFQLLKEFILNSKCGKIIKTYKRIKGKNMINQINSKTFEYSYCASFPYKYINYKLSNLQLFNIYIKLRKIPKYQKNKDLFIDNNFSLILKTQYYKTASFLVLKKFIDSEHHLKKPYAKHENAVESIYPNLIIYSNRGYCE